MRVKLVGIKVALVTLCLLLQTGCYVRTHLKVGSTHVPSDFAVPVLVVSVKQQADLEPRPLTEVEQDAIGALTDRGILCISLEKALEDSGRENERERLRQYDYRALLEIMITFWGSKTVTLMQPSTPSVESIDTDRAYVLFESGSIEETQRPGPESNYKEVAMSACLVDLRRSKIVWSGGLRAAPALVGRSFIYHHFNRSLDHEDLARRCLRKLAAELARIWPRDSGI
jgi:hypothetical protein